MTERRLTENPLTLERLAKRHGISRERVRQIEVGAVAKLARSVRESARLQGGGGSGAAGGPGARARPRRLSGPDPAAVTETGAFAAAADLAGATLTAAVFGGMVFFAFVYAPLVFTKLPAATAGAFIRAVFPVYYKAMGGAALAAGASASAPRRSVGHDRRRRRVLRGDAAADAADQRRPRRLPRRDAGRTTPAAKTFGRLHRLSVAVNFAQMLAVLVVLVRLLAAAPEPAQPARLFIISVARTSAARMPGSIAECPASGTMM